MSAPDGSGEVGLLRKPYQNIRPWCGGDVLGSIDSPGWKRGWIPMSSSLLAPIHLKDHWRMVKKGGQRRA